MGRLLMAFAVLPGRLPSARRSAVLGRKLNQYQGHAVMTGRRVVATPLAAWERDGLKAALVKAGLPAEDVGDARLLFWRFETVEDIPVGFGGLEIHGSDALLRSLVT